MDLSKLKKPTQETYLNERIFRPKTKYGVHTVNFFLEQGGLGDYICHMPAFEYLAKECPHVHGRIFVAKPFDEIAKHIMKPFKHWSVHIKKDAEKIMQSGEMIISPSKYIKYLNACGAHLLDLGFIYYCNMNVPPAEYNRMTGLTGAFKHDFDLPEKYAVLTPGATAKARTMPAMGFNALAEYLNQKGITPVFLGKADFAHQGAKSDYFAKIDENYDLSLGINLLEKTSLKQAIAVMDQAKMVIGLDNGLLHFAGCTQTPIIFGHSVTEVQHREIRRYKGQTINIHVSTKDLPCSGCQSRMRFVPGHRFKYCIYDDYLCLNMLFSNDAKAWKDAIDAIA